MGRGQSLRRQTHIDYAEDNKTKYFSKKSPRLRRLVFAFKPFPFTRNGERTHRGEKVSSLLHAPSASAGAQQAARAPTSALPGARHHGPTCPPAGASPILVIHLELSKRNAGFQAELGEGERSSFH